jgi:P-type E1-E2 ATPase
LLGSYHFVFEDNRCVIPQKEKARFNQIPAEYSHLYLSLNRRLAAVICIEDPIRAEAKQIIAQLKQLGIKRTVMLTGDNYATGASVAKRLGIDSFYSEVLPDDKANYIKAEKENGHCVIMLGDGINDSPALSEADVGIAVLEGAPIARRVADITINSDTLHSLVRLRILAKALQDKVSNNYRMIMSFNTLLIILGIFGILPPATAAYLHNGSTLAISLMAARPLKKKETDLKNAVIPYSDPVLA